MKRPSPNGYDSDAEDNGRPNLLTSKANKDVKKPLAITNFAADGDTDYEDMPGLQTVSNSSDDYSSADESDSDVDYIDDDSDDESGYNTEQEDQIRELLREAMDIAHEGGWFNTSEQPAEPVNVDASRDSNPFLKLLGSLRG